VQPDKRHRQPASPAITVVPAVEPTIKSARTRTSDAAARRAILVPVRLCSRKNVLRRGGVSEILVL
jgi:hypothetical protein